MKSTIQRAAIAALISCVPGLSYAYALYQYSHGRADYANRYDLNGSNFPAQAGYTYNFGKVGAFGTLPPGVTAAVALQAVQEAASQWSTWAAISFDTTAFAPTGTGMVRLRYDSDMDGAYATGYGWSNQTFAEVVFGKRPGPGVDWNATNFKWVMFHEFGHVLGLNDLYLPETEELVDHEVMSGPPPVRSDFSRRDNVMDRYNDGNNYAGAPTTGIDNDEIGGLIWLWGSALETSYIVTGDFGDAWNANGTRTVTEHHGHRTGGWWTYLGSVSPSSSPGELIRPLIDIEFPGFTGEFTGTAFGTGGGNIFEYVGPQPNNVHRFRINHVGFAGNFRLKLKSSFTEEGRVNAWVTDTKGSWTSFDLNPNQDGNVFIAPSRYVKVFGPVPEPSTMIALGVGLLALLARRKSKPLIP